MSAFRSKAASAAFPGTASSPIYVNLTGSRAEVLDACWCCAPDGQSCTPTTKSGLGRAILVSCFE